MKVFGISKPHPREVVSGDAWVVLETGSSLRVALVDGAGHGEAAASAAMLATQSLKTTANEPVTVALSQVHSSLHESRGAAVSIAEITDDCLLFGGIGNVEGRLATPDREQRLSPQRGIAGVVIPRLRVEELALPPSDWAFLLYSDGISHRFSAKWEAVAPDPEKFIAHAIDQWGRLTDDATMVVVLR